MVSNTTGVEENVIDVLFDPFNLGLWTFPFFVVLKLISVVISDASVEMGLKLAKIPELPSREPPIMKGLEAFQWTDITFLSVNQIIETSFTMQVIHFCFYSDLLDRDLEVLLESPRKLITHVLIPIYMMFLINDFCYYYFHWLMHHPALYSYVHKHHHRQALPYRGYWDAANDHPLENLGGQCLIYLGIWSTCALYAHFGSQVHLLSVPIFMTGFATFAFLNHTSYDLNLPEFLLGYSVGAHEMHHRFGRCNYSQNTMWFDKMFGTFREYKSGQKTN